MSDTAAGRDANGAPRGPDVPGVALGLLALVVAVFPANINMAVNSERFKAIPSWALWARLPLQFVILALVWIASQRKDQETPAA